MKSLQNDGSILWDAATPHLASHGIDGTDESYDFPATACDQAQSNRITAYLSVDDKYDSPALDAPLTHGIIGLCVS